MPKKPTMKQHAIFASLEVAERRCLLEFGWKPLSPTVDNEGGAIHDVPAIWRDTDPLHDGEELQQDQAIIIQKMRWVEMTQRSRG